MLYFIGKINSNSGKAAKNPTFMYATGIGGMEMGWVLNPIHAQKFTAEEVTQRVSHYNLKRASKPRFGLTPIPAILPVQFSSEE